MGSVGLQGHGGRRVAADAADRIADHHVAGTHAAQHHVTLDLAARLHGEVDIARASVDGHAVFHEDAGGAGAAVGRHHAIGLAGVGQCAEIAVVCHDVGIDVDRPPGLQRQIAAVALGVVGHHRLGHGDVVAGLQRHVGAGVEHAGDHPGCDDEVAAAQG